MRRGEIWWADLPSPRGRRPAVVVSRDRALAVRHPVTVVPLHPDKLRAVEDALRFALAL